uniref:Uncharacterized protein n=1 Tax=Solanum tuberosum TaxID=4113 RepID=M1CET6_SOLTU
MSSAILNHQNPQTQFYQDPHQLSRARKCQALLQVVPLSCSHGVHLLHLLPLAQQLLYVID